MLIRQKKNTFIVQIFHFQFFNHFHHKIYSKIIFHINQSSNDKPKWESEKWVNFFEKNKTTKKVKKISIKKKNLHNMP